MSSSSPLDLPGKLPKSSLVTVEEVNKAVAEDPQILQAFASVSEKNREIAEIGARLSAVTGLRARREALRRMIGRLETTIRRRREQVCRKLIHQRIKEARKELGIVPPV